MIVIKTLNDHIDIVDRDDNVDSLDKVIKMIKMNMIISPIKLCTI